MPGFHPHLQATTQAWPGARTQRSPSKRWRRGFDHDQPCKRCVALRSPAYTRRAEGQTCGGTGSPHFTRLFPWGAVPRLAPPGRVGPGRRPGAPRTPRPLPPARPPERHRTPATISPARARSAASGTVRREVLIQVTFTEGRTPRALRSGARPPPQMPADTPVLYPGPAPPGCRYTRP